MTGWKLYASWVLAFTVGAGTGWYGRATAAKPAQARQEALRRQERKASQAPPASAPFAEHADHTLALILLRQERRRAYEEGVGPMPSEAETAAMLDAAHALQRRAETEAETARAEALLNRAVNEAGL